MIGFDAKYYDGLVSESVDVRVEVDPDDTFRVVSPAKSMQWPLANIRISARLGNTPRKISLPDGAVCECSEHEALDQLLRRTGRGRTATFVHLIESSWRAALLATLVLLGLVAAGVRWGIPFAAKQVAEAIPPRLAYDLGRGTLAMLDQSMLEPTHLTAERRLELESGFSVMADEYPDLPLRLQFRRGVGPNAFALPDGSVIVSDELVAMAKDDQEILSVLMHEIGHVHHRHALRMALESSTVFMLVSTYLGDVTQLSTLSSTLPGVIARSHYSREHEVEADTFALVYLDRSHIPRQHYANILRSLQQGAGEDPGHGMQYLASHPPTTERIRRFEQ